MFSVSILVPLTSRIEQAQTESNEDSDFVCQLLSYFVKNGEKKFSNVAELM